MVLIMSKRPENRERYPENLCALCQRCHNRHDAQHRAKSRKVRAMWEQRRYEIAKELFSDRIDSCCGNPYTAAEEAVNYADILIEELKKGDILWS